MSIRIADLFCGIGGIAEAVQRRPKPTATGDISLPSCSQTNQPVVATAIDIDRSIATLYKSHHGITPRCSTIESLERVSANASEDLDMWWMSPPCQPYTRRGLQLGSKDSRSLALARLIELIPSAEPRFIGLENVPAFEGSKHHQQLTQTLCNAGYRFREYKICPTELGIPMRRKRYYLLATQIHNSLPDFYPSYLAQPLKNFIDPASWNDAALHVPSELLQHYQTAMNIIDASSPNAITACFTSAYGKSPIKSGSYLHCRQQNLVRRFSPNEIATLMGFRENFFTSSELGQRSQYRLIGNSLSVHVVHSLLSILFDA